jgi:threonine dehydrogenase-like Zn-dependent dehydrogenase
LRAVVYAGPGTVRIDDVARPGIKEAGDAVVEVALTAICGSDLHLLSGKTPGARVGAVIGHEFVGVVRDVGDDAKGLLGSRVVGSFLIACGRCDSCRGGRYNLCSARRALGLGTLTGDLDGAQAEFVRVPDARVNVMPLESFTGVDDEAALFCGDVLATGFHAAEVAAITAGERCAVFGAGPVGICCALASRHAGADVIVVDTDPKRAEFTRERFGLDAVESVADASADVVIDAVGAIPALKSALRCARDGGRIAVVGVYGAERYELPLGRAWIRALDIRFSGMANVQGCWKAALSAVADDIVDPVRMVTHRIALEDAGQGYELFRSRRATKVLMSP